MALSTLLSINHKWYTLYELLAAGVPSPSRWPSREYLKCSHCPFNPEETSIFILAIPNHENADCPLELSEFQLSPTSLAPFYTP